MKFSELVQVAGVAPDSIVGDAEVTGMVCDTREVKPGVCHVCMPSTTGDSHRFLAEARSRGAVAAITHSAPGYAEAVRLGLCAASFDGDEHFRDAIWRLVKAAFANPTGSYKLLGVTGTNGKTTVAWLARDLLRALGMRAGYIGTLGAQVGDEDIVLRNTTPVSVELNGLLAHARELGAGSLAIEVSSHALAERRADGLEFDAAVFTNLTRDHLDYHGTMAAYEDSKRRLFFELPANSKKHAMVAAINVDDEIGARWSAAYEGPTVSYGLRGGDMRGKPIAVGASSLVMDVHFQGRVLRASAPLGGEFNVWNCLAALAGVVGLGFPFDDVVPLLAQCRPAPGRFEAVPNERGLAAIVDYAHTPDALEKLLHAARPLAKGRLVVVFGCGGDRDRGKRPEMARAAAAGADWVVVTTDNPRTEDPRTIQQEVMAGIPAGTHADAVLDRAEAIAHAVGGMDDADLLVVAGKGHENYQIVGTTKHHLDDRELIRDACLTPRRAE